MSVKYPATSKPYNRTREVSKLKTDVCEHAFKKFASKDAFNWRDLFYVDDEKKPVFYSNGAILVSKYPDGDRAVEYKNKNGQYGLAKDRPAPDIGRLIKKTFDAQDKNGIELKIPEDFYAYLAAFKPGKKHDKMTKVTLHSGGINIVQNEDDETRIEMEYGEISYSELKKTRITFDAKYLHALKLSKLLVDKEYGDHSPAIITGAYSWDVTEYPYSMIMPVRE